MSLIPDAASPAVELYLSLLKRCLARTIFGGDYRLATLTGDGENLIRMLAESNMLVVHKGGFNASDRENGRDWPADAETMMGRKRLDNLHAATLDVLARGVPGDFLEAGIWRGGGCILMRAVLQAMGVQDRTIWAADSFEGLPRPNPELYPADLGDRHYEYTQLAVSLEQVQENFRRYGLLDDNVRFLKGWFKDTLATAPIEQLALLRADGDMYESTMDILVPLYPKLAAGGILIVDDYGAIPACKAAIHDYRQEHGITDAIHPIDWTGVYWRKGSDEPLGGTSRATAAAPALGPDMVQAALPAALTGEVPYYYRVVRPEVARLVPVDARRMLEVGCAAGELGAFLKRERPGLEVVGIERDRVAALHASKRLDAVIQGSVDALDDFPFPPGYFDCLVCADVLEHLPNPEESLARLLTYVKAGGAVVLSIPNLRHADVVHDLLVNGRFTYQADGILDRTHLRFYTLKEIEAWMGRAGLSLEVLDTNQSVTDPVRFKQILDVVSGLGGDVAAFEHEGRVVQYLMRLRKG